MEEPENQDKTCSPFPRYACIVRTLLGTLSEAVIARVVPTRRDWEREDEQSCGTRDGDGGDKTDPTPATEPDVATQPDMSRVRQQGGVAATDEWEQRGHLRAVSGSRKKILCVCV